MPIIQVIQPNSHNYTTTGGGTGEFNVHPFGSQPLDLSTSVLCLIRRSTLDIACI